MRERERGRLRVGDKWGQRKKGDKKKGISSARKHEILKCTDSNQYIPVE